MSDAKPLEARASGRICLLGEHADYLGLEVISFPLDLYMRMTAEPIPGSAWELDLADLGVFREVVPGPGMRREGQYDYIVAGFERVLAAGGRFPTAYRISVRSTIPIGKGVSSSSAFCVSWMDLLHQAADPARSLGAAELAEEAYRLEVLDFKQSGGMQDHYTIAFGRLIHLDCRQPVGVTPLPAPTSGFVLGDSGAGKDTQGVLSRIRGAAMRGIAKLGWEPDRLRTLREEEVLGGASRLAQDELDVLLATIENREQCRRGAQLLQTRLDDPATRLELGRLLSAHHHRLRTQLKTSTTRIDEGIELAARAGALGGKVLGSGAGGCFLAYAPGRTDEVVAALRAGGFAARAVGAA